VHVRTEHVGNERGHAPLVLDVPEPPQQADRDRLA
jgi:hypothetical protein